MSNLLYMDESNGNGVFAAKSNATNNSAAAGGGVAMGGTTTATASTVNNINNMMTAATTATAAAAAAAVVSAAAAAATLAASVSSEDLSQSLSEYTDADESISAPTEFLAEFLSAVMLKDYKKALKYCKLILQYEPNNGTAKEFYPLILEKLRGAPSSDSDENYNKSSSPEMGLDLQSSDPSAGDVFESDGHEADDDDGDEDEDEVEMEEMGSDDGDEYGVDEDNSSAEPPEEHSNDSNVSSDGSCDSCGCNSAGLSLSVDSVDDDDDVDDVDIDDVGDDEDDEDAISSSGDDLPIDDQLGSVADGDGGGGGGADSGERGAAGAHSSSDGGGRRSRSDNTTHSYSSLLLEEEDDIVPVNLQFSKEMSATDLDVSNGNKIASTSCSDSESPTEPLTQRLAAILRSKCGGGGNTGENY